MNFLDSSLQEIFNFKSLGSFGSNPNPKRRRLNPRIYYPVKNVKFIRKLFTEIQTPHFFFPIDDNDFNQQIRPYYGKILNNPNKKTDLLILKENQKISVKVKEENLGIDVLIMDFDFYKDAISHILYTTATCPLLMIIFRRPPVVLLKKSRNNQSFNQYIPIKNEEKDDRFSFP